MSDFLVHPRVKDARLPETLETRLLSNDDLPWHIDLPGTAKWDYVSSETPPNASLVEQIFTNVWPTGLSYYSSATVHNSFVWGVDIPLSAGLWNIKIPYDKRRDYCIMQYIFNGVDVSTTLDKYVNNSTQQFAYNQVKDLGNFNITTPGLYRVGARIVGRNAANTFGYIEVFMGLNATRLS